MQAAIDRQNLPFIPYMGSSASSNPPPTPGLLRAGDSFAAAMSVGDVTVAGIGTTTFVCEGEAVAFGHPFNWTGDTTMGIRAADTITIVKDPIFGSYKLANIAESLGTLTQDRLAGIAGVLGDPPAGSPVTSTVTDLDLGRTRTGQSEAIFPDFLPFLAFSHLFQNVDVTIDRIGAGSSSIDYAIRGTRDGGVPWSSLARRATRRSSTSRSTRSSRSPSPPRYSRPSRARTSMSRASTCPGWTWRKPSSATTCGACSSGPARGTRRKTSSRPRRARGSGSGRSCGP